jgi:hypothetical protein
MVRCLCDFCIRCLSSQFAWQPADYRFTEPVMDDPPGDAGKQPKDARTIRAALESIHREQEGPEQQGPLSEGASPDHRIVIASFHNPRVARSLQQQLSRSGIHSRRQRRARMTQVSVDFEDHQRATQIFDEHRETCPDSRPAGIRRDFDYMIFGLAIGLALGFVYLFGNFRNSMALAAPVVFALTGALAGHLIDRVRGQWRRTGRIRIGLWDFLILAMLPGLVAFIVTIMPKLLR